VRRDVHHEVSHGRQSESPNCGRGCGDRPVGRDGLQVLSKAAAIVSGAVPDGGGMLPGTGRVDRGTACGAGGGAANHAGPGGPATSYGVQPVAVAGVLQLIAP